LPRHEDIIDARQAVDGQKLASGFSKPALSPIADDGAADLFASREADADGAVLGSASGLGKDGPLRRAEALAHKQELRAFSQFLENWAGHGPGFPGAGRLSGKALAALGATAREHSFAAGGGHARAETVAALTDEPARLIGPLGAHDAPLFCWREN